MDPLESPWTPKVIIPISKHIDQHRAVADVKFMMRIFLETPLVNHLSTMLHVPYMDEKNIGRSV